MCRPTIDLATPKFHVPFTLTGRVLESSSNHYLRSRLPFCRKQSGYTLGVLCEERQRLLAIYLAAINCLTTASKTVADVNTEAWRRATEGTRENCAEALYNFNVHRREHGCDPAANPMDWPDLPIG